MMKLLAERIGANYHSKKENGMCFRIINPDAGDAKERDVAILYHKPYFKTAAEYAALFAAAPDLLAACCEARKQLSVAAIQLEQHTQGPIRAAMTQAHAAIEKAGAK